ncbi:PREDICTED: RING finger protein 212B-like isoform X2 [Amphimedon queenslandica]|uniref:RING-type domain-containing protein n=1 Tax=Amphimedon queenslandica TaxID=400682 RepID=A0AAN0JU74_AMPQE|nr:PREDICTED: RING finger protein 212B-like isoform X2 [Amphimedon queenslandica]|eukprot:XP_019860696.1 PREDICTED: RING finger protein 212B-like isoform X2 [Amphimedon queenslandica]
MAGAGPAVVNVKDWIHCNHCYTEPPKDRRNTQFIITSCGHLFCGKCYGEREKFCLVCKASCSVVDLSKQVPPDVMIYFHTPESIIQRFIFQFERVSKFQREQRTRLVKHKIQKLQGVAERKEREILLNEKENARLRQIKLNLESRSVSFPPSSSNSTTLRPPPSILRTGYGPIQTPPSFTRPHPSMTLPPSRGVPPSLADRPVGGVNTLTTFPMRGTNTPVTVSSDTRSFQPPPPPPKPTDPLLTGGRRVTPRESGRVTSRPHPLQSSIRRSGSSGESTPYISPSIVSSAVARRPTVAMTPAVNDSAVLSCIRARAQERGGAVGGASRGGGGEKRKLETESMRPPSGKRVLNSLIAPGRLSIRTPPINGKMGVIRSSRLLSSASPRHEDAPMSVAPTSNQTTINERLSAPLSLSAFQSQLANNGSYSHQRPPLVKMSSPRYSLHSSPMINSIRL